VAVPVGRSRCGGAGGPDSEVRTAVLAGAGPCAAHLPAGVLWDPRGPGEPAPAGDEAPAGQCRERGSEGGERGVVQRAGLTGGGLAGR
jgi:hypothetical protein